ncbi:PAS domain S-box protein [Metabacillus halosaccharovorans]|uniref:PAS domain S-box protein n=1 Tax=Metabacillus halosaccharovorans TaxID=930124 RepID=UPI0020419C28|nr:PAS domain S-box protein [Metabacillus halosaccharovorans]MCM3443396.1 PAS domain S-box protein [Metabacillus halosaccharovorans]
MGITNFKIEALNHIDLFFNIFNNMSDMVFLTEVINEDQFHYVLANDSAKKRIGLTNESFGKNIRDVLPAEVFDVVYSEYIEAVAKKKPITYEDKIVIPATQLDTVDLPCNYIYYESTVTPVFNEEEKCTHLLALVRDITDRKIKEKELKRVNDRLNLIWNHAADAIYTFDANQHFISVNPAFEKLLGWTEKELLNNPTISIIPTGNTEDLHGILDTLKNGETIPSHEVKRLTKSGEIIDVLASYSPIYDIDGNWIGAVVMYKDITEQKRIYQALEESENKYRLIAEHSSDLIKVVDTEGFVQYASPSHLNILGIEPDYYLNKSILSFVHTDDMYKVDHALKGVKEKKESCSVEIRRLNKNGEWIWFNAIGTPVFNHDGHVRQIIFEARDITDRKKYEERLKHLAYYDHLTGLPNRIFFSNKLKEEIDKAKRTHKELAVMFLDLDKFKDVNDTMGHDVGDELLKKFAERVSDCLDKEDVLARLGGDEFVILLAELSYPDQAIETANQVLQALQRDWEIEGHSLKTTSSIGIAFYSNDVSDKKLLKQADLALYQAKENGRNNFQVYREVL